MTRICLIAGVSVLLLFAAAKPAAAQNVIHVTGGGTGTFGRDIDGNGVVDGSHFGIGVNLLGGGAASGDFMCQMAGNAAILGLPLMQVQGQVSTGTMNADGSVTLGGTATVNLGNGTKFTGVPFQVRIQEGGPSAGKIQLTVIGAFDGVPGDQVPANGNYDLPQETVATGKIVIH